MGPVGLVPAQRNRPCGWPATVGQKPESLPVGARPTPSDENTVSHRKPAEALFFTGVE